MGAKDLIAQDGFTAMATSKSLKTEDNYLLKYRCRKRAGRMYFIFISCKFLYSMCILFMYVVYRTKYKEGAL